MTEDRNPGTVVPSDAGTGDASPMYPNRGGNDGAGDGSGGQDGSGGAHADAGGGGGTTDAGQGGGNAGMPDAGTTGGSGNVSCPGAKELSVPSSGGVVTAKGDTTGATDSQSPPASCAGLFAAGGPDHVYHLKMPFAGELEVTGSGTALLGGFQPSVYVATRCDDAGSVVACDYTGAVAFGATGKLAQGSDVFVYVDSGAIDLGLGNAPVTAGGYNLEVAARKLVGEGASCGTGRTDPHCDAATLACRSEASGSVCRTIVCGDGHVEGSEECDDSGTQAGDGCSAQCKSEGKICDDAPPLVLTASGGSRVAMVQATTKGAGDDIDPTCSGGAPDRFHKLTLDASASVRIELTPQGFDAAVALYRGTCANPTQVDCVEKAASGAKETLTASLAAGTYYIVADAYSGSGVYDLTVTLTP